MAESCEMICNLHHCALLIVAHRRMNMLAIRRPHQNVRDLLTAQQREEIMMMIWSDDRQPVDAALDQSTHAPHLRFLISAVACEEHSVAKPVEFAHERVEGQRVELVQDRRSEDADRAG